MFLFRLACRELWHGSRFALLFICSMALGLSGYLTLQSLKQAIQQELGNSAQALLAGDISISSKQSISEEEWQRFLQVMGSIQAQSLVVEFPALAATRRSSTLVQVKGLDTAFPLHGALNLWQKGAVQKEEILALNEHMWAWVDPEVLTRLNLKIGDSLRIGEYAFEIIDVILDNTTHAWRSFNFSPRVYLGKNQVEKLHLLPKKRNVVLYDYLFLLSNESSPNFVAQQLRKARAQPGISIHTAESASIRSVSALRFLIDFLSLASLVSLFLAAIGAVYLLRSFILARFVEIAILMCLGMSPRKARALYILEAAILGTLSVVPALFISIAFFPLLSEALSSLTPFKLYLSFSWKVIAEVLLLAVGGSVCVALPAVVSIGQLKPAALLNESIRLQVYPSLLTGWSLLPFLTFMWILAVGQSHSSLIGSIFLLSTIASIAVLTIFCFFSLKIIHKISHRCSLVWKLALRGISRSRFSSISNFLGVGLACIFINLMTQMDLSLDKSIGLEKRLHDLPSLVIFDMEEASLSSFKELASSKLKGQIDYLIPLVSAQFTKKNGQPFVWEKEESFFIQEEQEALFHKLRFNLTFGSEKSTSSEKIIQGRPYTTYLSGEGKIPEISLEQNFAKRFKLNLGDILEFDIQGISVQGQVVNLRKEQDDGFNLNFFIQFQPGVLEEAPKTYLAGLNIPEGTNIVSVQNQLFEHYPEISIINMNQAFSRLHYTLERMILAMRLMAWTSLATGLFVIFAISRYQITTRRKEISLMKVLGSSGQILLKSTALEFGLIALGAVCVGGGISYFLSLIISYFLFESIWTFSWLSVAEVGIQIVMLCVLCGIFAIFGVLRRSAASVLQEMH